MSKMRFTASVMVGSMVGAAIGAGLDMMKKGESKKVKKSAGKAFRNLGSVIDGILDMSIK